MKRLLLDALYWLSVAGDVAMLAFLLYALRAHHHVDAASPFPHHPEDIQ